MAAAFKQIAVGDPSDASVVMGPLAVKRQRERVEGYIAQEQGARIVQGGRRPAHLDRGDFIEPTVFANVDNKMTSAREEIFGPVVSIIAAENEGRAVEIENESLYGLNASVFTTYATRAFQGRSPPGVRHRRQKLVPHGLFHRLWRLQAVGHRPRRWARGYPSLPRDQDHNSRRQA